jgi:replicative DNA helicase
MIDRDSVEKAILINVAYKNNWELIIKNNLTKNYFSVANRKFYDQLKSYYDSNKTPDIKVIEMTFELSKDLIAEALQIKDLQGLCDILIKEYVKENVIYEVGNLNSYSEELYENPDSYVDRLGSTYERLKELTYKDRAVDLMEDIDKVVTIDEENVIGTGFKELEKALIGWRRGEELVVFVARTGQGKSWFGLKFALEAAMNKERVGIYSGEMSVNQLQDRIIKLRT